MNVIVMRAKEAIEHITPGNWRVRFSHGTYRVMAGDVLVVDMPHGKSRLKADGQGVWNAEFIAAAPSLVRDLIAEIEMLGAENKQLRHMLAAQEESEDR